MKFSGRKLITNRDFKLIYDPMNKKLRTCTIFCIKQRYSLCSWMKIELNNKLQINNVPAERTRLVEYFLRRVTLLVFIYKPIILYSSTSQLQFNYSTVAIESPDRTLFDYTTVSISYLRTIIGFCLRRDASPIIVSRTKGLKIALHPSRSQAKLISYKFHFGILISLNTKVRLINWFSTNQITNEFLFSSRETKGVYQ